MPPILYSVPNVKNVFVSNNTFLQVWHLNSGDSMNEVKEQKHGSFLYASNLHEACWISVCVKWNDSTGS